MHTSHIPADELQKQLRKFGGPLAQVDVVASEFAAHEVKISGWCQLHGNPHFWETDFNLREIAGPEEVLALANMVQKSFDKASQK